MHLRLGVNPDIAVFAKSLSNGLPMAAVLGTAAVMQAAQESFISSSFWTEAIGPAAALATLAKMQRINASALAGEAGKTVQAAWKSLGEKHGLDLTISGWPALCNFSLNYGDRTAAMRTLLTQEMLDRGFLANTAFYPTVAHEKSILDSYIAALDETFAVLAEAAEKDDAINRLRGGVAHSGFSRLT